jgi:hypothetical protein
VVYGQGPVSASIAAVRTRQHTYVPTLRRRGLVSYQGSPAALVIYDKQKERINLLVASSQSAVVAGGEEVRSGAQLFHYRTDQGFKVVTWSNHGLSYALVSSASGSARENALSVIKAWPIIRISDRSLDN